MIPLASRRGSRLLLGLTAVLAASALLASYGYHAYRGAERELERIVEYRGLSASERVPVRVAEERERIEELLARTPPGARILLLDVEEPVQPLFGVRTVAYWAWPRRIFSPQTLREGEFDLEAFVGAHGIEWIQDREGLRPAGSDPATPAVPGSLEESLAVNGWRAVGGLIAFVLYLLLIGGALLAALAPHAALTAAERAAASFLLGAGTLGGWLLLCFVTALGVSTATILAPLLPVGFLAVRAIRRGFPRTAETAPEFAGPPLPGRRALGAGLLALVLGMLVLGAGRPMSGWDSRMQWAHKAQILLHEPGLWTEEFQDPATVHFHPRYPLLVPALEAAAIRFTGTRDDGVLKLLFPLFWAALIGSLSIPLRRRLGDWTNLALAAFALVPYWWGYRNGSDSGAGFTGYPDLVLAAFVAGALGWLLVALRERAPRMLVVAALLLLFAGLTKAEGKVHVAVLGLVAIGWILAWGRDRPFRWRALGIVLAPLALVALHEFLVVQRTPVGTLPDDYSVALTVDNLRENTDRLLSVGKQFVRDLFLRPRHGFVGLLLLAAILVGRRRLTSLEIGAPLLYTVLMVAAFLVPYTAVPIYQWSAGRLLSQVLPGAWIPIALVLAGALRQRADAGRSAGARPRSVRSVVPNRPAAPELAPPGGSELEHGKP